MQCLVLGVILAALLWAPVASAQSRSQQAPAAPKVEEKQPTGQSGNEVKDSWLTTKTKTKLFADRRVKGRKISVETHAGVVTLRGKVESVKEKNAVEQIASLNFHATRGANISRSGRDLVTSRNPNL